MELDEQSQQKIREWIDEVPLSRPKKNFYRDFSDGGRLLIIYSNGRRSYKSILSEISGTT